MWIGPAPARCRRPGRWRGSADNHSYFTLVPDQPTDKARREDFAGTTTATFASANVRYLRITGRGAAAGGKLVMTNEGIKPSSTPAAVGPPITNKLIFDAGKAQYDTVNAAPLEPGTMSGTMYLWSWSAANWGETGRITGHLRDGYFAGKSGATGDAQLVIDYKVVQPMAHFAMIFYGTNTWQWGGKVEVSADNANWATLVDQTTPLGTLQIAHDINNRPIDAAHPLAVRYVRITDYCHAGSGTGTGRLNDFQSLASRQRPTAPPPVHRQDARHGRYASARASTTRPAKRSSSSRRPPPTTPGRRSTSTGTGETNMARSCRPIKSTKSAC